MGFKKTIGFAGLLAVGMASAASPVLAFANTPAGGGGGGGGVSGKAWTASGMMGSAYGNVGTGGVTDFTPAMFADWISTFTTWALGLAIAAFVLKIVLTAIDRMIFSNEGGKATGQGGQGQNRGAKVQGGGILKSIPLVGAYDEELGWKEIFIHFGKQVAVVAGAWILVQLVVNVVLFAFGAITPGA